MEPPLTSDIHTELKNLIRAKLLHFSWEMPTEINLSEKKSYFFSTDKRQSDSQYLFVLPIMLEPDGVMFHNPIRTLFIIEYK